MVMVMVMVMMMVMVMVRSVVVMMFHRGSRFRVGGDRSRGEPSRNGRGEQKLLDHRFAFNSSSSPTSEG
jgi:uncharacterized membrane protein